MIWQNAVYPLFFVVVFCLVFGLMTRRITSNGWDIIQLPLLRLGSVMLAGLIQAKASTWLHQQNNLSLPMSTRDYEITVGIIGIFAYLATIYQVRWRVKRRLTDKEEA